MALPLEGPEQTNNRAELKACITALRAVLSSQPLQVVTYSRYVNDGTTLYMNRWFLLGQKVANHDLWVELWQVLSARRAVTKWKHVYSHIGILGNERVDHLANHGRLEHPGRTRFLMERAARQGVRPVTLSTCYSLLSVRLLFCSCYLPLYC